MLYLICLAPVFLTIIYSLYLLVRPKNIHDEFFHLSRKIKKETMLERIRLLEQINQCSYAGDRAEIEKFYSDGRITEAEAIKMEQIITNTYFNNFKNKWIAFSRADLSLKCLFIIFVVYGFFYVNLVFIAGYSQIKEPDYSLQATLIVLNATLLLPYLFALTSLGFLAVFIAMLNLVFSERGGINRAAITTEELIKALKPGGRKTPVILGSAWSRSFSP